MRCRMLSLLLAVAAVGWNVDPSGEKAHVLLWVGLYLMVCVPLAVLCRHLIILHYRWRKARHEPPEATRFAAAFSPGEPDATPSLQRRYEK